MEDADEDFFDKLVDDVDHHFNITDIKNPNHVNKPKPNSNVNVDRGQPLVSCDNVIREPNNVVQDHGTEGGSGVKEVQWSAFASGSIEFDSTNVFGSGSDFLTEFDRNLVDPNDKDANFVNSEANSVGSVVGYSQVQESQSCTTSGRQSTDGQDVNNCHYWESLYPGWKYDQNTGQWYQVNEVYDATLNGQMADNPSAMSWSLNSHTSHTNESFSNWNQISQGNNNGYPSHFYFDPQYPGWYYDMNAQEWRSLDAYNCQIIDQNRISASSSYYGNEQLDKRSGLEHVNQGWQPDTVYNANIKQCYDYSGTVSSVNKPSQIRNEFPAVSGAQYFGSSENVSQPFTQSMMEQSEMMNTTKAYGTRNQLSYSQQSVCYEKSYGSTTGRSSAGQPPHALVTFGFGGKLLVMKVTSGLLNSSYGGQESTTGSISVLNLAESVTGVGDMSSGGTGVCGYFHALCRQSFPGPLAGGNVGSKELNRWIDERITQPTDTDYKKDQVLKLLLSLLKIASQHYGKLRSPFGTDATSKENDAPEVAVVRLFASAQKNKEKYVDYGAFSNCLKKLPSEGQTRAIAAEVQTLLVSGGKMEALHRAQEGQLWGIALVLAAQLGDQFYAYTVRNMALRQLVVGSPLRTLCLLIAGQPADVFSADPTADDAVSMFQQPAQAQLGTNAMLDNWEENIAMITANRTKDDELVLIHLGDCLWKETSNIIAAHICYLVAEANFEPYSDTARLCLIGADHWKHPRTYASPEAIQRTEVYEYAKLLGNSQFTLLPFQPYKFIYANMLAEVGRISDSLKYCQVISKSLKTCRAPEVETWRLMVSSLEDRIKTHQEGGFSTGKFVGKLLNLIDSTASRVVGLPPPVPSTSGSGAQTEHHHQPTTPRVSSSQPTMTMSSLAPSASMEPITQNSADGNTRRIMHNRSVSEPDFANSQSKSPGSSGFGRLGSQLFETLALVLSRPDKQAKMGEPNKFYYDNKLGRWVEEGVEPPAEEATLAAPPKGAAKSEGTLAYGSSEYSSSKSSGIPPLPATSSQFSARARTGVRQRYVDTFNQGGGNQTKFQSPSAVSNKPAAKSNPQIFVPKAVASVDQPVHQVRDNAQQSATIDENPTPTSHNQFQPPSYQSSMQRFASMDDISRGGIIPTFPSTSGSPHSRRTVSWGGSTDERFAANSREMRPNGAVLGVASRSFVANGDGFSDNLDDVEL